MQERVDSNRMAQSSEFPNGLQPPQPQTQLQQAVAEETISPHKIQTQTYSALANGKTVVDGAQMYMSNGIHDEDHHQNNEG